MKRNILKAAVFILVFVLSAMIVNRIMNRDYDSMTMEMSEASLPVISINQLDRSCNRLFGYTGTPRLSMMRDCISVLDANRSLSFDITLYGSRLDNIQYEVRDTEEDRLIENNPVTELEYGKGTVSAKLTLKDLYEKEKEYLLVIKLALGDGREASYFTRLIWSEELHFQEKISFVEDFHTRLYNKEAAKELIKYLEPNASLVDNSTLHKVNIHSSFKQITWGDLPVEEVEKPRATIKEISNQTMSVVLDYRVKHSSEEGVESVYLVHEYYRVRYTPDRMYLLSYERETNQLPDVENMCANNKILLGIGDEAVDMLESTDGNTVVFESCNRLFSYNTVSNKLVVVFSFYEDGNFDERNLNNQHGIKILGVDEAGNIDYVVYGYMNRGTHEGETGIWVRRYESSTNTSRESLFVSSDKPYRMIENDAQKLLYLNKLGDFYFLMDDQVLCVNLDRMSTEKIGEVTLEDSLYVSNDNTILVWQNQESEVCQNLQIYNLSKTSEALSINANYDEVLHPLGFMGEDIIYGVAKKTDLSRDISGTVFLPMYKVIIASVQGSILKQYENAGIYVTGCSVEDNQITLNRVRRTDNGSFENVLDDHITNNEKKQEGKNTISAPAIDLYGKYVQIQVKTTIDTKSLQVLQPKDVVFEDGRKLELPTKASDQEMYYVFTADGVCLSTRQAGKAVSRAYEESGTVVTGKGKVVWTKKIRTGRNQIMAIKEPDAVSKEDSYSVCLDAMLEQVGINKNTKNLLERGLGINQILEESIEGSLALNLQGCSLDAVLYYVSQDIPVYALLGDQAVLITGYNEFNTVLFEPSTGKLYKKGLNDSAALFSKYGNQFFTYYK